ncbi:MAG: hypothetical protein LBC77_07455 [Spirochaetaceae bacterium]|jgi:D-alanyl-lipoteichoic acid acyltransferase DltB (MBOAT superfamily)|nr:hypothetical protein [Spirochaetaceae bacterium]
MSFNSPYFFIFLLITALAARLAASVKSRRRDAVYKLTLLCASLLFSAFAHPAAPAVLMTGALCSHALSRRIEGARGGQRRLYFIWGLAASFAPVFFFKYAPFLTHSSPRFDFFVNAALSFFALRACAYITDVYRGELRAETGFLTYALFIMFFPAAASGVLEKPRVMLPLLKKTPEADLDGAARGLRLILWGLFKKTVIADRAAIYTDAVFDNAAAFGAPATALAIILFSIQIYCDLSACSDIAVGAASLFNIKLSPCFKTPYFASSIGGFWRRFSIPLAAWFKDYIYKPARVKLRLPRCLALGAAFALAGLWYGGEARFALWGALHGLLFAAERRFFAPARIFAPARALLTFAAVSLLWVFFRAQSAQSALYMLARLRSLPQDILALAKEMPAHGLINTLYAAFQLGQSPFERSYPVVPDFGLNKFMLTLFFSAALFAAEARLFKNERAVKKQRPRTAARFIGYYALAFAVLFFWSDYSKAFLLLLN